MAQNSLFISSVDSGLSVSSIRGVGTDSGLGVSSIDMGDVVMAGIGYCSCRRPEVDVTILLVQATCMCSVHTCKGI